MRNVGSLLALLLAISLDAAAVENRSTAPGSGEGPGIRQEEPGFVTERQGTNARTAAVRDSAASPDRGPSSPRPLPSPNIGFIDSPSAICFQPDPSQDVCQVNWYYLSVDATPNYVVSMWVLLGTKVIMKQTGFFQTSAYIPGANLGLGFKVQCGPPVDDTSYCSGPPCTPLKVGNTYSYTVRAKDSANLTAANYGSFSCPAYIP